MEIQYTQQWEKHFGRRLQAGRLLQSFFGNTFLSNVLIKLVKPFPKFVAFLIQQTHGKPF
jgi:menaquinone-9 beta-reductase